MHEKEEVPFVSYTDVIQKSMTGNKMINVKVMKIDDWLPQN